ncbi:L-aspartate oxidase [Rhodospirillum centenum]|uniref:L-aspartate oxidase n=1 Tax=Rhodospirillum centenum (strain ATCC 51521 / SW) TaxID=414684 RepID=B6IVN4_RHOCS|nr:L-aspartate oxidase [Rhodospirillum centenum]ACJ00358.1 L-aspartate oxidase [Rhodospirillum centenum SW]
MDGVAVSCTDVLVVGSGLAGMVAALRLAPRRVTLLTKTEGLPGGSSLWAQGGIAAALGADDTPEAHAADTVEAGAGLTDPALADLLAREGAQRLAAWIDAGLPVDRDAGGRPAVGREAAHSAPRILHAGGDATGRTVVGWLAERVRQAPHITVRTGAVAWELVRARGRVCGLLAFHAGPGDGAGDGEAGDGAVDQGAGWVFHRCGTVLLATGGIGQLYRHSTNPAEATGDGLALAALAGAGLRDLEFVQFHPTALATDTPGRTPLLTEALRGAGALLLDGAGRRFMPAEHPLAELAPRDVVARAIGRRVARGEPVLLDLRAIWAAGGAARFPTVAGICAEAGIDPVRQPVPVAPAAHYHMGGIATDRDGRSDVPGLWACGEVAGTGVHGANRLASNSLLEALVFAERAAAAILAEPVPALPPLPVPAVPALPADAAAAEVLSARARAVMSAGCGLVRDGAGLEAAAAALAGLQREADALPRAGTAGPDGAAGARVRAAAELRSRLIVSRLIVQAALARCESRGAHFRTDWPEPRAVWRRHRTVTLDHPADAGTVAAAEPPELALAGSD